MKTKSCLKNRYKNVNVYTLFTKKMSCTKYKWQKLLQKQTCHLTRGNSASIDYFFLTYIISKKAFKKNYPLLNYFPKQFLNIFSKQVKNKLFVQYSSVGAVGARHPRVYPRSRNSKRPLLYKVGVHIDCQNVKNCFEFCLKGGKFFREGSVYS